MTLTNNSTAQSSSGKATTPMLIGAAIGLVVISIFVFPIKHPNPDWGKLWMIRPLLVVPFAGAMGGLFYHLTARFRNLGGWKMILTYVINVLVFLIGLWMGIVLGLAGTLWN